MSNNDQDIKIKLIAEAESLIAGFKLGETAVDKLKQSILDLQAANKELAKAEENLQKVIKNGNEQEIKSAEKTLEQKAKVQIQVEKSVEKQINAVQRVIAQEEKNALKASELAQKEAIEREKAEERKRRAFEKTQQQQEKQTQQSARVDVSDATKGLGGIGDLEKIATAATNPIAAIGLLIETFAKLSDKAKESIKEIGEKFSEFVIGLSEGSISANSFVESIKGNISDLGEEFGFTGTAIASFTNIGLSLAQSVANITLEVANEQKVLRGLNQTLDISTATLRGYETALSQAGISVTRLPVLLVSVNTALEKLKEGSPKVVEGFKAIGLSLKDLEGLNTEEKFKLIFERIRDLNAVNKEAAANATFAITAQRRAVEPIDLIARNYEKASKSVERFGAVVSKDGDKALVDLQQSLLDLSNLFSGVRIQIAEEFAPQLKQLADIAVVSLQALKGDENVIAFFNALGNTAKVVLSIFKGLIISVPLAFEVLKRYESLIPGLSTLTATLRFLGRTTEDNKKAAEELAEAQAKEKEALHATELTAKQLKETLNSLEEQTSNNTKNAIADSELRIAQIEKEEALGKKSALQAGEEILAIKQDLSAKLIAIEEGKIAVIEALGINDVDLIEKADKAKAELAKLRADREQAEIAQEKKNRIEASNELISQAKIEATERIAASKEAQAAITDQENEGKFSHEEAARQRSEITKNQIKEEIQQYKSLLEDDRLTNDARRKLREDLSKAEQQLGQADLNASKEINKAKKLDDKETADEKKRVLQDQIKQLENSIKVLSAKDKVFSDQQKNNIDDVVDRFKRGELDKQTAFRESIKIQLDAVNFSVITQLQLLTKLTEEQSKLKKEKQDTTKVDDDIILANQKIQDLQRIQGELQDALKGKIDGTSEAVNKLAGAFGNVSATMNKALSGEEAINERVANSANRADSAVGKLKGGLTVIGESFDLASLSVEQLQDRIIQLQGNIDFIRNVVAIGDKDAFINPQLEVIDKLNEEIVNRTQRAAIEKANEELRIAQEKAKELQDKLVELNQERLEKLADLEKDFREDNRKLNEDRAKENDDYLKESTERLTKYNDDRKKLEEDYAKKESEIREKAAQDEIARVKALEQAKTNALNEAEKERNSIVIKNLVDEAKLIKQINDEKDPKKKAELEKQLTQLTAENAEKEKREKEKNLEIQKALESSSSKEEFEAKKKAIEEKFDLLENEQAQRQAIIDSGDKARLAKFDEFIKKEKERIATQLQQALDGIKQEQILKAKQQEEDRAQRAKDFADKQKEREDQFKKEQADADREHKERLNKIEDQQKEIRAKFKQTYNEINQEAIDSAKQIGATAKAVEDAFNIQDNAAKKYLSTLGKIKDAQGGLNLEQSGGSSSGSNSQSTGNTSTGIGNSTGSQSSGNSSSSSSSSSTSQGNSSTTSNTSNTPSGQAGSGASGGQSKNEAKKDRANEIGNLPTKASSGSEYKSAMNKIYDSYAGQKQSKNIQVKYFDVAKDLTVSYFESSGITKIFPQATTPLSVQIQGFLGDRQHFLEALTQLSFAPDPKLTKESKSRFNESIDRIIAFVEGSKKGEKGTGKTDISSIGTTDPGTSGALGGSAVGGSGGTKGTPDPTQSQNPDIATPPPTQPKDTRFDPKKENVGEGAEAEGFQFSGPGFPTGQKQNASTSNTPTANVNATANVQNGFAINNLTVQVGAQSLGEAIKNQLMAILQSGEVDKAITNQVAGQMSKDNFSRNPGKRIIT